MPNALAPVVLLLAALCAALPAQVPSPLSFLGHEIGADRRLCNYTELSNYFDAVAAASDRVQIVELGPTSYGQRMRLAVVSSPQNLARIDRLREIAVGLAHVSTPEGFRLTGGAAVDAMIEAGRAVVWIDGGLHATETLAGQNIVELLWRMASRDDDEVRRILDEVVLLICPVNPDGYELVGNAYRATGSTGTPVLYQRYIGHDNNRDFYACNQLEAQHTNRVLYREWCPQIVYNHHQTAPRGTILFTPPFRDPFNYQIDPLVMRGIEIVSAHMNHRFALEGKPGVISRGGASYSAWWNGGLRSTAYFHNVIGILTEAFGRPEPTPVEQTTDRRLPNSDYPDPVPSQLWHARQTIEYLQTANFAILDYAARHRRELLRGIWTMGVRAVDRGSRDHWTPTPRLLALAEARGEERDSVWSDPALRDPRVYVLRSDQRDWSAGLRFARALWHAGVELQRATEPFRMQRDGNEIEIPSGSLIVRCDQPYRAHVLDMFEPQWHPDDVRDGKPVPPYDAAGWTLSMQMGVEVERSLEGLRAKGWEPVTSLPEFTAAAPAPARAGHRLDPADLHTVPTIHRLHAANCRVEWSPRGFYWVPATAESAQVLAAAARELGVRPIAADVETREARTVVEPVRVGLFDVYGGHMPTGWDLWLLRQFEFPVQQVWGARIEAGDLRRDFDVLIFHTGLPGPRDLRAAARRRDEERIPELQAALPPFEDWSDLPERAVRLTGENALPALREFVAAGGTLIALGGEVEKVVRHFELPIEVGTHTGEGEERRATTRDEFYVPGSLLALEVDPEHPIARGVSPQVAAMVDRSSTALEVLDRDAPIDVVARFRNDEPLLSGWAIGTGFLRDKAAVLCARVGDGRVVLCGADVTYRGQPLATAKLLFQAVLSAGERR